MLYFIHKKTIMVWVRAGLYTVFHSQENNDGMGEHRFVCCILFTGKQ